MADVQATPKDVPGWAGQIVLLYETFLLRDLLGYAFPGAVLLLGADRLCLSQRPVLEEIGGRGLAAWPAVALGLAAAYAAGVCLRLAGTWAHLLVIAPVIGWCGDPWSLRRVTTAQSRRSWHEAIWRSRYEPAVVDLYQRMRPAGAVRPQRIIDREDIFLHLAGNLGLALLLVALTSLVGRLALAINLWGANVIRPLSDPVTALALLGSIVFIAGHYRHARTIWLLLR